MSKNKLKNEDSTELVPMPNVNTGTGELTYPEGFLQQQTIIPTVNIFQLAGRLKALKDKKKGISISSKYLDMVNKGDEVTGIFIGYKYICKKDDSKYRNIEEVPEYERENYFVKENNLYKKIEVVEFAKDNGEVCMIGSIQFISAFKEKRVQTGQAFYAQYAGIKNRAKIFDIYTIDEVEEVEFELQEA
jgi:hypothetical protein